MALETRERIDFDWITPSQTRVLRELAALRTAREAAERLGMAHSGFRSIVEDIKLKTGLNGVRDIGRWWLDVGPIWLDWMARQGGVRIRDDAS